MSKSNQVNNIFLKRMNSREETPKSKIHLHFDISEKTEKYVGRKSTKVLFNKFKKEKITEFTNRQKIDNINEYTRQCLEIIPDLFSLKEIPRCKAKIHPNFQKRKKIALFDLDETIVHCIGEINMNNVENFTRQSDTKIKVKLPGGKEVTIGINIRPHWEEALNIIKDKYHILAYTASHESYADSVLNYLDPEKKYFEYKLYRSHCVLCTVNEMKFYVKDLGILEEFCNLKDVVLIDNSVLSFAYHLDNGIPISPFYDSKKDYELLDIANFLYKIADEDDIRNKLREVYKLSEYLEIIKNNINEYSCTNSSSISVVQEDEESEATNKKLINTNNNNDILNNNRTKKCNIIEECKNVNNEKEEKNSKCSNDNIYKRGKTCPKIISKYEKIQNLFEKINLDNYKRSRSSEFHGKTYKKYDSTKINDFNNNKNIININLMIRKKNKYRTFHCYDINFKKEWDKVLMKNSIK